MLTNFLLFPKLPKELQILIWHHAVQNIEPREFSIRRAPSFPGMPHPNVQSQSYWVMFKEHWTTRRNIDSQPPSMLSTTSLSRQICKGHFKLAFGGIDNAPVWFNFQNDILSVQKKFLVEMSVATPAFTAAIVNEASLRADCAKVQKLLEHCFFVRSPQVLPQPPARRFRVFESVKVIGKIALDPWGQLLDCLDGWTRSDEDLETVWEGTGKPIPLVLFTWTKEVGKFDR
ncbi:hypothetical protein IFR05_005810 [Cadophora sp. M221]|nr:hypothetical protein IFR05_005810 [Cadophora sp. M221]